MGQHRRWGWAEKQLRKHEQQTDTFTVFKRCIIQTSQKYVAKEKLLPPLARRLEKCLKRGGARIGK